ATWTAAPLQMSGAVDRASPVPLYFQIEGLIEQEILSGRIVPNTRLPAEPELANDLGVSRSVVRQALIRLEHEGLLSRVRGHGTFVAERQHRSWRIQGVEGFFEDEARRLGKDVTSRVLRAEVEELPTWASDALALDGQADGVVLERLRYLDGSLTM